MTAQLSLRHCPLCGIAMQTSKTEGGEVRFDCLTCRTTIVERPANAPARETKTS